MENQLTIIAAAIPDARNDTLNMAVYRLDQLIGPGISTLATVDLPTCAARPPQYDVHIMLGAAYTSFRRRCKPNWPSAQSLIMTSRKISRHGCTQYRTGQAQVAFAGIGLLNGE